MSDLASLAKFPHECHNVTTRNGEEVPCEKPAVAARLSEDGDPYPVCAWHTRGECVPLAELLAW